MNPTHAARSARAASAVVLSALVMSSCGGSDSDPTVTSYWDNITPAPVQQVCSIPRVTDFRVATENGEPITDKNRYRNASLEFSGSESAADNLTTDGRIRGRGNTTWFLMPKKPYKVKLDQKMSLFGFPEGKEYAVLANYADKSMLRTELAYCLASVLRMPYTPHSHFVELTLNGSYDGLYQYTNKVYEVTDHIEAQFKDGKQEPAGNSSFDDVFLLEIDARSQDPSMDPDQWFPSKSGIPYKFRSDTNAEHRARVKEWIDGLESIIGNNKDPDRLAKLRSMIDLGTLIDYYLLSELTGNPDTFYSSTYVYRMRDGLLTYGPVWDFDTSAGNAESEAAEPRRWHVLEAEWNWYFRALLDEPEFRDMVLQRWSELYSQVPDLLDFVRASSTALDAAQTRNFERWPILNEKVPFSSLVLGSYEAEVQFLLDWLAVRADWMNENIDDLAPKGIAHEQ
ncbi:MAG: CotH kinase family protein [Ottowia sp.]|nr:CotH kinase family protein [Ottowia sp.]